MRVLFLCHPESDYGGSFIFNGLCTVLGDENVYDYPVKWSYHGRHHAYAVTNIPEGHTDPCAWAIDAKVAYKDVNRAEEEVLEMLQAGAFDFVLIESMREWCRSYTARVINYILAARIPIILHHGEDYHTIPRSVADAMHPDVILLRECKKSAYPSHDFRLDGTSIRVLGFPFSCAAPQILAATLEESNRDIGVDLPPFKYSASMLCGRTHPQRQCVADALRDTFTEEECYVAVSPDDRNGKRTLQTWPQYLTTMSRSLCAVNVFGFGMDTVRFWEIPMLTTMLSTDPELHYENPLVPGTHYVSYRTPQECCDRIRYFQNNVDEAIEIYQRGVAHVMQHHTNEARAKRIVALAQEYKKN